MNKETGFQIDEVSRLLLPDLHDAEILGISRDQRSGIDDLLITLTHQGGRGYFIRLEGVEFLDASNFSIQNIVSEAFISTKKDVSGESAEILARFPAFNSEARASNTVSRIQTGDLTLFDLSSSNGCHIYSICRNVKILSQNL